MRVYLFPRIRPTTLRKHDPGPVRDRSGDPAPVVPGSVTIGVTPEEERHVTRDLLIENLRWLAAGNPEYAGTDQEGRQNLVVAHLMADDFLLSYIDDQEVTELFSKIRKGYSP